MADILNYIITALIAAVFGALTPVLVARYSRTREERDSGLAMEYLKLADMSGEQLEKKINQIAALENQLIEHRSKLDALERENKALRAELVAGRIDQG